METTTPNGTMPIPTFRIVEEPYGVSPRQDCTVYVNDKEVCRMPDVKSAKDWIARQREIFDIP